MRISSTKLYSASLPEHERPVVGEDLAQVALDERGCVEPLVDPVDRAPHDHEGMSQKLGPTGSVKSPVARSDAVVVDLDRQLRQGAGRGPVDGPRAVEHVERRLVARDSGAPGSRPGTAPARSRRACRSSSTRRGRRARPPARSGGSCSWSGSTRIRTACESADPTNPSGKTVVNEFISSVSIVTSLPSAVTSRAPGLQSVTEERAPGRPPERPDREQGGQAERARRAEQHPRQESTPPDLVDAVLDRLGRALELGGTGRGDAEAGSRAGCRPSAASPTPGGPAPTPPRASDEQRSLRPASGRPPTYTAEQPERGEDRDGEADRDPALDAPGVPAGSHLRPREPQDQHQQPQPDHDRDEPLGDGADPPELQAALVAVDRGSTARSGRSSPRPGRTGPRGRSGGITPGPTRIASAICTGSGAVREGAIWPPPTESPDRAGAVASCAVLQEELRRRATRSPWLRVDRGDRPAPGHDRRDVGDDRGDLVGRELRLRRAGLVGGVRERHPSRGEHEVHRRPGPPRPGSGRSRYPSRRGRGTSSSSPRTAPDRRASSSVSARLGAGRNDHAIWPSTATRRPIRRIFGAGEPRRASSSHRSTKIVANSAIHTTSTKCQ